MKKTQYRNILTFQDISTFVGEYRSNENKENPINKMISALRIVFGDGPLSLPIR